MGSDGPKTIRITVHGDVQGVGFRWFTRRAAQGLGLAGNVANRPDGTVRIVARGSKELLERLLAQVRQGPSHSSVTHLDVEELPEGYSGEGFEIVH